MANITGGLVIASAARLVRLVDAGGQLVVGGFTDDEEPGVRDAFHGVARVTARYAEAGWVALRLTPAAGGSEVAPDELQQGDRGE